MRYLVLGFLCPVNHTGSPQDKSHIYGEKESHIYSDSISKKLAQFYIQYNQLQTQPKPKQSIISASQDLPFIYLQLRKILPDRLHQSMRHIQYKIKTQLIKSQACLIHCYGVYTHKTNNIFWCLFIFHRHLPWETG